MSDVWVSYLLVFKPMEQKFIYTWEQTRKTLFYLVAPYWNKSKYGPLTEPRVLPLPWDKPEVDGRLAKLKAINERMKNDKRFPSKIKKKHAT